MMNSYDNNVWYILLIVDCEIIWLKTYDYEWGNLGA